MGRNGTLGPLLLLAGGVLLSAGCSRARKNAEDFTPSSEKARQALEAALTHWQAGNASGPVPGTAPVVQAVDTKWKAGQKLQGFEILGEDAPNSEGAVPRFFKVRLTPANGPPQEARYVVVGIDPLWVYREEDYKAMSGMSK
jgi:hypothetical protein